MFDASLYGSQCLRREEIEALSLCRQGGRQAIERILCDKIAYIQRIDVHLYVIRIVLQLIGCVQIHLSFLVFCQQVHFSTQLRAHDRNLSVELQSLWNVYPRESLIQEVHILRLQRKVDVTVAPDTVYRIIHASAGLETEGFRNGQRQRREFHPVQTSVHSGTNLYRLVGIIGHQTVSAFSKYLFQVVFPDIRQKTRIDTALFSFFGSIPVHGSLQFHVRIGSLDGQTGYVQRVAVGYQPSLCRQNFQSGTLFQDEVSDLSMYVLWSIAHGVERQVQVSDFQVRRVQSAGRSLVLIAVEGNPASL